MPKAYSYLRFSTPEQLQGDSYRRQTDLAERYATQHGLELDTALNLKDLGVSAFRGRNARQGALGGFLRAVDDGLVEAGSFLLVESLDRVSRQDPWDALPLFQQIINAGVVIVTLQDGKVYSRDEMRANPLKILESLFVMIRANEESATKSRRLAAAWSTKRTKLAEKPLTSLCPAWLRFDPAKARFVTIKDRAEIVRRIFRLSAKGVGVPRLVKMLNGERVHPFGRAPHWHASYIKKILANPAVCGRFIPHTLSYDSGKRVRKPQQDQAQDDYYPRIVSDELFAQVQRVKDGARAPLRGRHANAPLSNILGGLTRCPLCGSTMSRVAKGSRSKPHLVCAKARVGAGCRYHSVRYDDVERTIVERSRQIVDDCPAPQAQGKEIEKELCATEGRLDEVSEEVENLLDAIQAGGRTPALVTRLRELEEQRETLRDQRDDLLERRSIASGPLLIQRLKDLRTTLDTTPLDRTAANALLRQLLRAVTINWRSGELELEWAHGGTSELVYGWPEKPARRRAG